MLTVVNNPLVLRDVTTLRDVSTPPDLFRAALHRIGTVLAVEAAKYLGSATIQVRTPLEETSGSVLEHDVVLLAVLRSGIALVEPFRALLPEARIGYIGLNRNEETLAVQEYYFNLPVLHNDCLVFVLDPMLATGGSIVATLERLAECGVQRMVVVCAIAAPEGVERVETTFPAIPILTASLDRCLNAQGFILPGLGDAGDRYHGT
jgi:uracil phosphoribosyltransferase